MDNLIDDTRTIRTIFFPGGGEYKVGRNKVEAITAYPENGQMATVPWFAIHVDGAI